MADAQEPTTAPVADPAPTNGDAAVAEEPTQTNGTTEEATTETAAAEAKADEEEKAPEGDAAGAAEQTEETAAATNKSKRKSTGGVPEHKSKKLNKKKSMPQLNLDLSPGDYVWARLKGYPPWPSICCDESMLPESLLGTRPVSTKRPDGSYREDYADGGKNVRDRTYPVMFLHTNEFAWMGNTSLTKLDPSECEDTEKKKLSVQLKEAYKIATEGNDLDHFKGLLKQHDEDIRAAEQEEREKAERKAAEAAEKAEKKERRKSKAGDEMDVDGAEKPSKKRKKDAESDGDAPKAKKTPKVKLSAKESQPDSAKKPKSKKKADKEKEEATSQLSEEERLARREKAVFYLRHKLQRCFLTPDKAPNAEEMDEMATHFSSLESHHDLEPQVIRKTKIHKVLKNIVRLENIPREDEFHFKKRSSDLLDLWGNALAAADGDASIIEPASATNGDAKPEEATEEKAEPAEEKPKEESEAPKAEETAEAPAEKTEEAADVQMTDAAAETTEAEKPAEETPKSDEKEAETETKAE